MLLCPNGATVFYSKPVAVKLRLARSQWTEGSLKSGPRKGGKGMKTFIPDVFKSLKAFLNDGVVKLSLCVPEITVLLSSSICMFSSQ